RHRPAVGAVPVELLDAALAIPAVAAHVELADAAGAARLRIGTSHDARDEVAGGEPATVGRFEDSAERFVAQDESIASVRRPTVVATGDLAVRPAHADGDRLHQKVAGWSLRL